MKPEQSLVERLRTIIGCFEAAEVEGLTQVLAETKDERLKDLVRRRLMFALYGAQEALESELAQAKQFSPVGWFTEVLPGRWEQCIDPDDPKTAEYIKDCGLTLENTVQLYTATPPSQAPALQLAAPLSAELPELPPHRYCLNSTPMVEGYTAEQMRDYARAAQRAAPTSQPAVTIYPGDHDFPVDLIEKIRNASSIMGIATDESLEGCSVKLKSILYSLCRAIDRMRDSLNAPTAQGSGKDAQILAALETGLECAEEVAFDTHQKLAGYKPHRHAAVDADVQKIKDAIAVLEAAAAPQEAPQQEPVGWFTEVSPGRWEQSIDPHDPKNADYIKECGLTFEGTIQLYAAPVSTISAKVPE